MFNIVATNDEPFGVTRRRFVTVGSLLALGAYVDHSVANTSAPLPRPPAEVICSSIRADGIDVFYREAGRSDAPVLLLLHGFPNSSHYFRNLMPKLADRFHLIAPDFPSFGFTVVPEERRYQYSFASFTDTLGAFIEAKGLRKYAMYVFDYGAPIGFRHALKHPDQVTGFISQNGNAYDEGLGEAFWRPVRAYWKQQSVQQRELLRRRITLDGVKEAYLQGAPSAEMVGPESYWLDASLMMRPGNADIQLDLKLDYRSNVALYPEFQQYFRARKPPTLAMWGKYDPAFIPLGAEAFRRDIPDAQVSLLEAGHFALETEVDRIAAGILDFGSRFA
jgi:pimeloyl-ACP methyl ester carboxylesterase